MNNTEKVKEFIFKSNKILCDDCLSEELKIYPRQQINQIANKLGKEKEFIREKRECERCLKFKLNISKL